MNLSSSFFGMYAGLDNLVARVQVMYRRTVVMPEISSDNSPLFVGSEEAGSLSAQSAGWRRWTTWTLPRLWGVSRLHQLRAPRRQTVDELEHCVVFGTARDKRSISQRWTWESKVVEEADNEMGKSKSCAPGFLSMLKSKAVSQQD